MTFKLIIHPDVEFSPNTFTSMHFDSLCEMNAASRSCADLLIFIQDKAKLMHDSANMFVLTQLIDGEYVEIDENGEVQ